MSTLIATNGNITNGNITNVNTGTIKDSTGNTTAMTIDGGGRMTQPANPAFIAIATGSGWTSITTGADYAFPYNETRVNRGNNFNTSTYQWTAPIDCIMMFGFQAYMDANSANYTRIKLYENGSTLIHEQITAAPEVDVPEGASQSQVMLDVTAGRTYQWKVEKNGTTAQVYLPASGTTQLRYCYCWGYMVA
tara:strand:+ start:515 stop:1090 length:576 start_codon:yes stop_codon:yes gene_type:complete